MNRQLFKWISELVADTPNQTTERRVSSQGKSVLERYHCGYLKHNRLVFTAQDKLLLRQRVKEELGLDPFTTRELPDDRLEMAAFHANEKLASKPAGHDHLLLNSPNGNLRLNGENIALQPLKLPTAGLMCLNSGITTVEHTALVVVENLAMMQVCTTLALPPAAQNALWIYRGDHKSGAKADACREFVERFGADKDVIVFSDMDPKGLEIALTMPHVDYWLGPQPESWDSCLNSRQANRDGFDLQRGAMAYLQRVKDSGELSPVLTNLLACLKQHRSSYRQEHMASHAIALALFPVAALSRSERTT
ncbi:MAG: DUF7281 domain-containing protein [Gammaproteobacteria bacterium]